MNQLNLTPSEQLTYRTTRIVCWHADGSMGTGSGFFYAFARQGNNNIPAIVTNKHVVAGAVRGQFALTLRGPNEGPVVGQYLTVELDNFEGRWIPHSDPSVDLCVMPIAPLLHEAQAQHRAFFFILLDETLLPSDDDLRELGALEDILMIGYPNGIWDSTNNMPILRRGVTATHPNLNYEGRSEFMIDTACFPGSSGSPVFLFNVGSWPDRQGNIVMGGMRIKLLGILYAGPQHTAAGEVRIVNIPTQHRAIAFSTIPNNLGLVVKAARLRDMESIIRSIYPLPPA